MKRISALLCVFALGACSGGHAFRVTPKPQALTQINKLLRLLRVTVTGTTVWIALNLKRRL